MLQKAILFLCFLFTSTSLFAQYSFSAKVVDHESGESLVGVTVYFPELEKGGSTNSAGEITVSNIPAGTHQLTISYVGYETLNIKLNFPLSESEQNQTYELHHDHEELEEIFVNSTRSSRTIEDSPSRVEFIAGEELAEKGNMKPGDIRMLLNESTGIQTQQTSATSYNSSIRIQGLDGKYTQLLRDGLPLYSGYSGGLTLMQIAPLDLKQVEVIKGASSTLYGAGAIAGLVNLITKTPEDEPELSLMLNGTSALGFDGSAFYSEKKGNIGTTVFASYNHGTAYDPADIGLTAIPEFDRFTLNPKLFVYLDKTTMNFGVNIAVEDRLGGNMNYINGDRNSDIYFELNETNRISSQFQLQHILNEEMTLTFKNSVNYFDRSVSIRNYTFAGAQFSSFSEANVSITNSKTEWIGGINLWTDTFEESENEDTYLLNFSDITFGAFLQNTVSLSSIFTLESGLRFDLHSEYGNFLLPRLSLLAEPSEQLTLRFGGGLGYKPPTVFTEDAERIQFQDIQPLDKMYLDAENSIGGNLDINFRLPLTDEIIMTSNILFFYTRIEEPIELGLQSDELHFDNRDGFINSKGVEVNLKWSYKDLKLFIGYTHANVQQHYGETVTDFPLVAKHRLNNVLMYEKHGNFWIGLEAYFFSPQTLSDGSTGQSYWITGLMTEKRLNETFSVFLNFENFLDARQSDFDVIYSGSVDNPNFKDIYAPVDGFVINGGIKLNLK